jgi:hypothetical protein
VVEEYPRNLTELEAKFGSEEACRAIWRDSGPGSFLENLFKEIRETKIAQLFY